jgi:hypothetical protein
MGRKQKATGNIRMSKEPNTLQDIYGAVSHLCEERQAKRAATPGNPHDDLAATVSDLNLCLSLQAAIDAGRKTIPAKTSPKVQAFLQECNLVD